jgi:hypothetical protein
MATPVKGLCVAPFGMDEGTEVELPDQEFALVVGEAAEFRFFGSSVRRDDAAGAIVDEWCLADLDELTPLEATLGGPRGGTVPVRLSAHVTELGTLEVWCVAVQGTGRWKLEFNLRAAE